MKRPTMLFMCLVEEILRQHNLSASKDLQTIASRLEKEGEGFLSLSLPSLGASLEKALEDGLLTRQSTPSFGHDRRKTIPRFLKGLFSKIFSDVGILRDDAC